MNKTVPRVGLIGISGYGRVYLNFLESAIARHEVNLVAAVVINRKEEAEACQRLTSLGVTLYDTWQTMLQEQAGKLDLCMIPAPIHLHKDMAIAALESGTNVLVEKPLAGSIAQAQAIQEAERRTGRWVAVGYQDFYSASTKAIRAELAAGRIGRVRAIRWLGLWPRNEVYYNRNRWAGRLSVENSMVRDSPLNNAMAHFLNLSLYWSGATPAVTAQPESVKAELFRCFPIESFDTAVMHVRTRDNVSVEMAVTHCCPTSQPIHIQVLGDSGEINWSHREEAVWTTKAGEKWTQPLESAETTFEMMLRAVLAHLQSPQTPIYTTTMALSQVHCIEMLHAGTPIRTITADHFVEEFDASGGRCIRGIEDDLRNCLEHASFPSELGMDWAKKSPRKSAATAAS